jgi:hypothetical protein
MYQTILATQQCDMMASAGQPGERLCKQNLFIAALDCVAAFIFLLHDFNFDIRRNRV